MKFNHIEVSGLTTLIINRKQRWVKSPPTSEFETWTRIDLDKLQVTECVSHREMVKRIKGMNRSKSIRMWIHGDTINVTTGEKPHVRNKNRSWKNLRKMYMASASSLSRSASSIFKSYK